ncbi:MAG: hypothetical protein A2W03_04215 [Candidatus Aminicenantes bacterium RBG_16_63_16]|nr:MAG: hypothetical protein A2W03_04215 [Candidatus Aminicenantes bacterium RBG_16_63_16]
MKRRELLKHGAGLALSGLAMEKPSVFGNGPNLEERGSPLLPFTAAKTALDALPPSSPASPISAEDQRRRLVNIGECERGIRRCLRRHLIQDYLPGQVVYNLGEYPCRKPWNPDDWDEEALDNLKAAGVELVQLHDEWNDLLRLFGAHKFRPLNEPGFRRFVDMVHARGLKLIVYASSGFFDRRDPDFREEWARPWDLVEIYWHCAYCSPASPGWRAYLLPRMTALLDDYGVDGIYNDLGYKPIYPKDPPPAADEVFAFEESEKRDGALEDLLGIIYGEVKKRNGIVKIHYHSQALPRLENRIYDYLWVGESVRDGDGLREAVKAYPPYVVPCLDMSRAKIEREDELYLHAIPYMQFPLLLGGRPFTGERAAIPGIKYQPEETDFWTAHCRRIWRYYQEHPEGPHSFGWWDSCPGRPEARPTYERWMKLYKPMVEPGTVAYLEIGDGDFFTESLPPGVVASAFANRDLYLVLANYSRGPVRLTTSRTFVAGDQSGPPAMDWSLPPRSLLILKRAPDGAAV